MLKFSLAGLSAILILFAAPVVWAHGGSHQKEPIADKKMKTPLAVEEDSEPSPSASQENIYAVGGESTDSRNLENEDETDSTLSESELFGGELEIPGASSGTGGMDSSAEPMSRDAGHGGHSMPDIKVSKHQWVSPSQKGYGAAVGITLLAALAFGALNFMRPKP